MHGRDVCGRARTGSGKTLAFGVPMLARILDQAEPTRPLGLVLVPTRELAVQVAEVLEPVANYAGQRILAVYGGASRHHQIDVLREGVEIVVATPLRLIDLLKSDEVSLADVDVVVLDEADRMADDGFTPQVEWILRHCTARTQTMLFSATLDGDVGHLIRHYLKDPVEVAIDSATDTVGTMHHLFLAVHHMDKVRVVAAIGQGVPKLAVFCQTKRLCDKVAASLVELGVDAAAIHGDLPQVSRERALRQFAEGKPRRARRHRRRRPRARHRRHRRRRALRPAEGRQGLPPPLGPHGPRRSRRVGGDAGRVQPAHPDAHPPAHVAPAARRRRSRCSATTSACAISTSFAARRERMTAGRYSPRMPGIAGGRLRLGAVAAGVVALRSARRVRWRRRRPATRSSRSTARRVAPARGVAPTGDAGRGAADGARPGRKPAPGSSASRCSCPPSASTRRSASTGRRCTPTSSTRSASTRRARRSTAATGCRCRWSTCAASAPARGSCRPRCAVDGEAARRRARRHARRQRRRPGDDARTPARSSSPRGRRRARSRSPTPPATPPAAAFVCADQPAVTTTTAPAAGGGEDVPDSVPATTG